MNQQKQNGNIIAIITMFFLFAMISFVTNLAAPFGTIWKNQYAGANTLGMMGNMMNFLAYLFMGIPSGNMLVKIGYKKTALIAMAVSIPTGEIAKVEGTPMDFRTPQRVDSRINDPFEQLKFGAGYDHCYVLNKREAGTLSFAAKCVEPESGRSMEVYTTEPGVQVYTSNWHNGFEGAHGATFPARSAICFEAQHFPDTPNKGHFPSCVLHPGETYSQVTIYKFGVEK